MQVTRSQRLPDRRRCKIKWTETVLIVLAVVGAAWAFHEREIDRIDNGLHAKADTSEAQEIRRDLQAHIEEADVERARRQIGELTHAVAHQQAVLDDVVVEQRRLSSEQVQVKLVIREIDTKLAVILKDQGYEGAGGSP